MDGYIVQQFLVMNVKMVTLFWMGEAYASNGKWFYLIKNLVIVC